MLTRPRAIGLTLGLALLLAGIDQSVKWLVVRNYALGEPHTVLPGILDLRLAYNTGAAFSLMRNAKPEVLLSLSLGVLVLFAILVWPHLARKSGVAAAALIIGGAIGNLVDRARLHYVVDYLDFHVWPVFNIADSCVVIGVFVLVLIVLRAEARSSPPTEGNTP